MFKKVIMKLSGNAQWVAGMVFERDLASGERTSEFEHHYNIILRNPTHMNQSESEVCCRRLPPFETSDLPVGL
jgi:hypothetical protein